MSECQYYFVEQKFNSSAKKEKNQDNKIMRYKFTRIYLQHTKKTELNNRMLQLYDFRC